MDLLVGFGLEGTQTTLLEKETQLVGRVLGIVAGEDWGGSLAVFELLRPLQVQSCTL